jgi:LemA protein
MLIIIILGFLALILIYLFTTYNKFVTIKTRITASIQEIGNQLKRQADLIPNLQESVKGYIKHEKENFDKITEARKVVVGAIKSGQAQKLIDAGEKLQSALAPIRAVFESTPQLQAKDVVVKLMDELRDTADKVMYARRTLIDLTADFNTLLITFPSKMIAQLFSFKKEPGLKTPESGKHLEVSGKELEVSPKVKL